MSGKIKAHNLSMAPQMLAMIEQGATVYAVAKALGVHRGTVTRVTGARSDGQGRKLSSERRAKIVAMCVAGERINDIRDALHSSTHTIIRVWREAKASDPNLKRAPSARAVSQASCMEAARMVAAGRSIQDTARAMGIAPSSVRLRLKMAHEIDPSLPTGPKKLTEAERAERERNRQKRRRQERRAVQKAKAKSLFRSPMPPRREPQQPIRPANRADELAAIEAAIAAGMGCRYERHLVSSPLPSVETIKSCDDAKAFFRGVGLRVVSKRIGTHLRHMIRDGGHLERLGWMMPQPFVALAKDTAKRGAYRAIPLHEVYSQGATA